MSKENILFQKAKQATLEIIKNHGVAAIPISVFYADKKDDKLIRFCFAKDSLTLQQATLKLCAI